LRAIKDENARETYFVPPWRRVGLDCGQLRQRKDFLAIKAFEERLSSLRSAIPRVSLDVDQRRYLVRSLLAVVSVRVAIVFAAYFIFYIFVGREGAYWRDIFKEAFIRWDAANFLRLAEHGYQAEGELGFYIVYLPAYPYAVAVLNVIVHSFLISALVISAVSALVAGFLLQQLVSVDGGDDAEATRALWYMTLFPTAYFLAMPYSESMFLMFVIAAFLGARTQHWGWAGIMAAFATATRVQGLAILPGLAIEALVRHGTRAPLKSYWLALAPVGFLVYLGINWVVADDPFRFVEIQRDHWHQRQIWPWEFMRDTVDSIRLQGPGFNRAAIYELRLIFVVVSAGLLLLGVRKLPLSYQAMGWAMIVMMMMSSWQLSIPRYTLGVFPLFLVMAYYGKNPLVHQVIMTTTPFLMGIFYVMFATRFGF